MRSGTAEQSTAPAPQPPAAFPGEYLCPITQEMLVDPVVAEDGHTYERAAITRWFDGAGEVRSPVTNEHLTSPRLVPNHALRKLVEHHRDVCGRRLVTVCSELSTVGGSTNGKEAGCVEVQRLLERGADVNGRDADGNTALMMAVRMGRTDVADCLISAGALVTSTNDDGATALDLLRELSSGVRERDEHEHGQEQEQEHLRELEAQLASKVAEEVVRLKWEKETREITQQEFRRQQRLRQQDVSPGDQVTTGGAHALVHEGQPAMLFASLFGLHVQSSGAAWSSPVVSTLARSGNVPEDVQQTMLSRALLTFGSVVLFLLVMF